LWVGVLFVGGCAVVTIKDVFISRLSSLLQVQQWDRSITFYFTCSSWRLIRALTTPPVAQNIRMTAACLYHTLC